MKTPSITINGRHISSTETPYVIAELSANHNGKLEVALRIIEEARKAGADAVKLQTYRPDTITLNCDSDGRILYELYEEAYTPWEWHKPLFEYAKKLDITIFSSPFDNSAVDLLEDLNAPAYKIASFEAVDLPLIKYAASTGKPVIISTGMADLDEINEAIEAAHDAGCKNLAILHCVSGYPAPASEYNLRSIPDLIERFDLVTGISDHTLDNITAITSVAMGACIIEKHVTLSRDSGGPDDSFSLEPQELEALCRDSKIAWASLGKVDYERKNSERENAKFRRSLYFIKEMKSGDVVSADSIKSVRPGYGLSPKYYDQIIGKQLLHDVSYGTPVSWDHLSQSNDK